MRLTPFTQTDASNLVKYMNDDVLYANTSKVPKPYTEEDAATWLGLCQKELAEFGKPNNWAIRHETEGVIGGIGAFLHTGLDGHRDEIGYWLAAPFRGKGIMTETIKSYCNYLLESRPSLIRIEAKVFAHNPASFRALEKAGFEQEGFARKLILKDGVPLDAFLMARFR